MGKRKRNTVVLPIYDVPFLPFSYLSSAQTDLSTAFVIPIKEGSILLYYCLCSLRVQRVCMLVGALFFFFFLMIVLGVDLRALHLLDWGEEGER